MLVAVATAMPKYFQVLLNKIYKIIHPYLFVIFEFFCVNTKLQTFFTHYIFFNGFVNTGKL